MDYKNKYLKYKKKYLSLKNQYGGEELKVGIDVYNHKKIFESMGKIDHIGDNFIRIKDNEGKYKILQKKDENITWSIWKGWIDHLGKSINRFLNPTTPTKEPMQPHIDLTKKKYMFLVYEKIPTSCRCVCAIIAKTKDECIELLKENPKINNSDFEQQFSNFFLSKNSNLSQVNFFELKNTNEESRIVKSYFLLQSCSSQVVNTEQLDIKRKFIFFVDEWDEKKCGCFYVVIAVSKEECFELLKVKSTSNYHDQIKHNINICEQGYELKDTTEESRIVENIQIKFLS
jgi:hypothetical protein